MLSNDYISLKAQQVAASIRKDETLVILNTELAAFDKLVDDAVRIKIAKRKAISRFRRIGKNGFDESRYVPLLWDDIKQR